MKGQLLSAAGRRTRTSRPAPWRWAVAGALFGSLLVLLASAPARWLAAGVKHASNTHVQLIQTTGTVWSGSGQLKLTGGTGSQDQATLPDRVHWRLGMAGLGLKIQIHADCCTVAEPLRLRVTPRWQGMEIQVDDGQSRWPAAPLAGLGTPLNTIQAQGELTLSTQQLVATWVAGRLTLLGSAELIARNISSRLSTLRPMGSYQLRVDGGSGIHLSLSTLEGSLLLSGEGQWVGSRLRFQGEARAAPGLEAQLANLLNVLGRRQADRAIISIG